MAGRIARRRITGRHIWCRLRPCQTYLQLTHTAQRLAAEQAYGVKLAAAAAEKQHWYDLSQRQSKELAEAQAELEKSRNTLQEQTRAAVDKDGSSFNGIGPNSLHLYKRAFGYTD